MVCIVPAVILALVLRTCVVLGSTLWLSLHLHITDMGLTNYFRHLAWVGSGMDVMAGRQWLC